MAGFKEGALQLKRRDSNSASDIGTTKIYIGTDNIPYMVDEYGNISYFSGTANIAVSGSPLSTLTSGSTTIIVSTNSGVVSGTYGSPLEYPSFVVDSYGRIISATNITLSAASGSVTSVGVSSTTLQVTNTPITSSGNIIINLSSVGTSGTYTKVTTDVYGRVITGTTLTSADIPQIQATKIGSGNINDSEFEYLEGTSANIQYQINQLKQQSLSGTGAGTINKISKFYTSSSVGDSSITDNGSVVTFSTPISSNNNITAPNFIGNASTSTSALQSDKLKTGRSFSISGDISSNVVSFDGTGNVVLSTNLSAVVWNKIQNVPVATTSTSGVLTSVDWNKFNTVANNTSAYLPLSGGNLTGNLSANNISASNFYDANFINNKILISTSGNISESTISSSNLLYLSGTSANIQTQFNNLSATNHIHTNKAFLDNINQNLSTSASVSFLAISASTINVGNVSNTEFQYLNTVSANIQTQLTNLSATKADKTTTITAGAGLTGGGNLSSNRTISLATTGTSGTYTKVTTNSYGQVTAGTALTSGDIPQIPATKIGSGNINNTEFEYLNGVSANIQNQLNSKQSNITIAQNQVAVGGTNIVSGSDSMTYDGRTLGIGLSANITNPRLYIRQNPLAQGGGEIVIGAAGGANENEDTAKIYMNAGTRLISTTNSKFKYQCFNTSTSGYETIFEKISSNTANKDVGFAGSIYSSAFSLGSTNVLYSDTANKIVESSITSTELGYLTGTSANIQTQLTNLSATKADKTITITAGTGLTGGGNLTTNRTISLATTGTAGTYGLVVTNAYGQVTSGRAMTSGDIPQIPATKIGSGNINNTEFEYLNGVTSNIQTQLNGKQSSLGYTPVNIAGDAMIGDLKIEKTSPTLILNDNNSATGSYPSIQFDTGVNQGISIVYNEFDGELPAIGYGLIVTGSPNNTQFPTTGTLSLSVLGEIYSGSTTVSGLSRVLNQSNFQTIYPDLYAVEILTGTSGFLKKTAANTWILDTNSYLTGNQTITLTGIVTGSGTTSITTSIANGALSIAKTSGLQSALDGKWNQLDSRITDDVNNAGNYNRITDVQSTALNNPGSATDSSSYLVHIRNNAVPTQFAGQLAITNAAVSPQLAIRNKYNGNWAPWKYALMDADNPDLVAIEALTGTSGFLKKTAANTWTLDTNSYLTTTGKAADSELLDGIDSSRFVYGGNGTATTNKNGTLFGDLVKSGFYDSSTSTDSPVPSSWTHLIHGAHTSNPGSWGFQLAANFGTGNSEGYFLRTKVNNTWTSWRTIWTSKDFTSTNIAHWDTAYTRTENSRVGLGAYNAEDNLPLSSTNTRGVNFGRMHQSPSAPDQIQYFNYVQIPDVPGGFLQAVIAASTTSDDLYFGRGSWNSTPTWNRVWSNHDFTYTDLSNWNTAYGNTHTHSNKSHLDTINQSLATTASPTFDALTVGTLTTGPNKLSILGQYYAYTEYLTQFNGVNTGIDYSTNSFSFAHTDAVGNYIDTPLRISLDVGGELETTLPVVAPSHRFGTLTIPSYPYTLARGSYYYVWPKIQASGAAGTIYLPASPQAGDSFMIFATNGASGNNTVGIVTINASGKSIIFSNNNTGSQAYYAVADMALWVNIMLTYDGTYWYAFKGVNA